MLVRKKSVSRCINGAATVNGEFPLNNDMKIRNNSSTFSNQQTRVNFIANGKQLACKLMSNLNN